MFRLPVTKANQLLDKCLYAKCFNDSFSWDNIHKDPSHEDNFFESEIYENQFSRIFWASFCQSNKP